MFLLFFLHEKRLVLAPLELVSDLTVGPHVGGLCLGGREYASDIFAQIFEVVTAKEYPGSDYDLVAIFDALHDMGDPVGACSHILSSLAEDGTFMLVEPMAGDALEENIHALGAIYYAFSTTICTPSRSSISEIQSRFSFSR